ncbi:hypothetical protein ACRE_046910 [Hapsidospora chrysogenum ATCC 11550]|uniref:Uncharacterized protein n=1 Tax=Hapsidospora chrysogenum (strain ATCC 11550 / CBS 779.69 / DSM 880 / IAM 14645 / JCM 23072 / IMI 49137) TaxID=857340 RepID=A0A086T586_HAPC1|nr:hypothetical protein ACRE_046910 [Hapsidospora chrysogenum ATCC 11550]
MHKSPTSPHRIRKPAQKMLRREMTSEKKQPQQQQIPQEMPQPKKKQPPIWVQRRMAKNPELRRKIDQMGIPLSPLVQVNTGHIHPAFPRTVLHFWLLTDRQLEDLAHFYHQRTPSYLKYHYPCPISWHPSLPLEEKRRKIGKFIGLRECESPVSPVFLPNAQEGMRLKTEEEIAEEARRARWAQEEDEMWERKMNPFYPGGGY